MMFPPQPDPVVSEAVVRRVEKQAAVIDDEVERLRFVRQSLAAHEAAVRRRARFLRRSLAAHQASRRRWYLWLRIALMAALSAVTVVPRAPRRTSTPPILPASHSLAAALAVPKVWLVERQSTAEIYSNGLRIDNQFLVSNHPRAYRAFDRIAAHSSEIATRPAGIVFHTTESRMAPFEPSQNDRLQRNGRSLLAYIAQHRLYHFVIDRFGRVFRVVAETDAANHAGQSIWADDRNIYWGLNQSFLGIAFEAQTEAATGDDIATRPQIDAARVLTEMLRSQYTIAATNCVTHAQVSVNPQTMRLGYHTDWAANFPFRQVGLGDGYHTPIAALTLFGFDYDSVFLKANGRRVWPGLVTAEEQLVRDAAAHGATLDLYRLTLRQNFHAWKSAQTHAEDTEADRP